MLDHFFLQQETVSHDQNMTQDMNSYIYTKNLMYNISDGCKEI